MCDLNLYNSCDRLLYFLSSNHDINTLQQHVTGSELSWWKDSSATLTMQPGIPYTTLSVELQGKLDHTWTRWEITPIAKWPYSMARKMRLSLLNVAMRCREEFLVHKSESLTTKITSPLLLEDRKLLLENWKRFGAVPTTTTRVIELQMIVPICTVLN